MGENISKWSDRQGISLRSVQTVHVAQYQEKKKKKRADLNRHFPRDIQMVKKHMKKKMLNITNCQGNANQNYSGVSPHTSQNGHRHKIYKQETLERIWKRSTLYTVGGNLNWYSPLWRITWRFLKRLKRELSYHAAIPLLCIYLEKTTIWRYRHPSVPCSTAYDSQDMETV